jgi:uncharacterized damage-inducible protein DinB
MTSVPRTSQPTNPPSLADHLEALDKSFQVFSAAAKGYPRDLSREKPTATAFSATEIVYHVLDVERLWQRRIRGLLDATMTKFQQMDPDKEARDGRYNEKPYDAGISEWEQARKETITLLREMKPRELLLSGVHSKYGEMNSFAILKIMEEHDRTHAAQLERTLAKVSQAKAGATLHTTQ